MNTYPCAIYMFKWCLCVHDLHMVVKLFKGKSCYYNFIVITIYYVWRLYCNRQFFSWLREFVLVVKNNHCTIKTTGGHIVLLMDALPQCSFVRTASSKTREHLSLFLTSAFFLEKYSFSGFCNTKIATRSELWWHMACFQMVC